VYETLIQCSELAITRCELLNSSKLENAVNFTSLGMQNQFLSMHDINVKTKLFWHPVYIAMLAMHKVKLVAAAAKCHEVIREDWFGSKVPTKGDKRESSRHVPPG